MKQLVELARELDFSEAADRCKKDPQLVLRRTEDASGFSVWGAMTAKSVPLRAAPLIPSGDSTADSGGRVELTFERVRCYRCSGRGSLASGSVCTHCSATGWLQHQQPRIAPSDANPVFAERLGGVDVDAARKREMELIRAKRKLPLVHPPEVPGSSTGIFCRQCLGDGGAGGRCPRCGGNGMEP